MTKRSLNPAFVEAGREVLRTLVLIRFADLFGISAEDKGNLINHVAELKDKAKGMPLYVA